MIYLIKLLFLFFYYNLFKIKIKIIFIAELRTIGLSDATDSELSYPHFDLSSKESMTYTPDMKRNKLMQNSIDGYSNYLCPPTLNVRQHSDSSIINSNEINKSNNDSNNDRLSKSDTSIGTNSFSNENDRRDYEKNFRDIILDINNINSRLEKALSSNNNSNSNNENVSTKLNMKKKSLKRIGGGFGINASKPLTLSTHSRHSVAMQGKYKLNNQLSIPITLTVPQTLGNSSRHPDLPSVTRSRSFQEPSTTHLLGHKHYHHSLLHPMGPYNRNRYIFKQHDFDDSDTEVESLISQNRRSVDSDLEIIASKSDNDAEYYDEDEDDHLIKSRALGRSQSSDVQGGHVFGRLMKKMGKFSLSWKKTRSKVHRGEF